jgi:membrane protein
MVRLWQEREKVLLEAGGHLRLLGSCCIIASKATFAHETSIIAAAIGYFTLFSLFPLTLITVAIGSLWLDPVRAESEIVTRLEFVAPAFSDLLGANIDQIVMARGPMTGFAFLILLWSASNIFNVFTRTMDRVWRVEDARTVWRYRGLAILFAMTISLLLLLASFVEGIISTVFSVLLPETWMLFRTMSSQWGATVMNVFLFVLLYYFLPHVELSWRDVLPGALAAGFLWEGAKHGLLVFVANFLSRTNVVYGSLATIMVFLTWTYVSSFIFLFGTYLNVEYVSVRKEGHLRQSGASQSVLGNPLD